MTRILVAGASGMLGSTLVPSLRKAGYSVITQGRTHGANIRADLTKAEDAHILIGKSEPDVVINLIGLTNVDECEHNLHKAFLANTKTVENLANAIQLYGSGSYLIHLSTDQVYDGDGLKSEDNIKITNNYAMTKYAGELATGNVRASVLRTNFVGRSQLTGRVSLSDWVFNACANKQAVSVFDDVFFNPLSMHTLATMIQYVIEKQPSGTFNLGSHGGMSKADFAFLFAERVGLPTKLMTRTSVSNSSNVAAFRPKNMKMDVSKIETALSRQLPRLTDEILTIAEDYRYAT